MAKILVAEDEPDILNLILLTLEHAGFQVVTAEDGKQAYELALHERPDLVLMDVRMPDMNGYESCRRIKSEPTLQHVPVVFISVRGAEAIRAAFDAGATDYLLKPFSPHDLTTRINQILSHQKPA